MNTAAYQFLNHLDAPKRYFTLTIDEAILAASGLLVLVMAKQSYLALLPVALLMAVLKRLKKGQSPRILLLLAWWYLPHALTQFFVPKLPASHYRVWTAWVKS